MGMMVTKMITTGTYRKTQLNQCLLLLDPFFKLTALVCLEFQSCVTLLHVIYDLLDL